MAIMIIYNRGWWTLTMTSIDEGSVIKQDDETTLEHIGKLIKKGFTEGEIIQEEEVVNKYHFE